MAKPGSPMVDETAWGTEVAPAGVKVRVAAVTWGVAATLALVVFGLAVTAEQMGLDQESGASRTPFGEHECAVWALAYSPDGRTLASAGTEGMVQVWESPAGEARGQIRLGPGAARALAYSPDGRTLAVGGFREQVLLYDTDTGAERARIDTRNSGSQALAFSPDGRTLALVGAFDGSVTLWDVATGQPGDALEDSDRGFRRVVFSPDGRTVAASGVAGSVTVWDVATRRVRLRFQPHQRAVLALAISPDGRTLATGADLDPCVKLWDLDTGNERGTLRGSDADPTGVTGLAFDPGGGLLADVRGDGKVTLWNIRSARVGATLHAHTGWIWAVTFSPDGRTLATGGTDKTIRIWDIVEALQSGRG